MIVEHTLEIVAVCPVDKGGDKYAVTVRCRRTIPVEDILAAIKDVNQRAMFQEDFTDALHRKLAAEVETVGWHSGVMTRVVCGGP